MKKIILTFLLSTSCLFFASAQFDNRFYFPSKQWNNIEGLNYKEFNFEIDTISINTILIKPEITVKGTVIYFHGSSGNITTYINHIRPLINAGYQIFMIDFRGYGKSTGVPTHKNIAMDAQYIFEKIIVLDEIKNSPVIIYGASMGTQIATKIAKDNQTKISALVLDGTISSFTDMALASVPDEQKTMVEQYVTSPYSAKNDIKEIKLPKLFIQGSEDKTVPFEQFETVYENALTPKELWIYRGEHLESAKLYPEVLVQKVDKLLNLSSQKNP